MRKRKLHILPRFEYQSLRWPENEINNVRCHLTFFFQLERDLLLGTDNVRVDVADDQRQLGSREDRSNMNLGNEQNAVNYCIDTLKFLLGRSLNRSIHHTRR